MVDLDPAAPEAEIPAERGQREGERGEAQTTGEKKNTKLMACSSRERDNCCFAIAEGVFVNDMGAVFSTVASMRRFWVWTRGWGLSVFACSPRTPPSHNVNWDWLLLNSCKLHKHSHHLQVWSNSAFSIHAQQCMSQCHIYCNMPHMMTSSSWGKPPMRIHRGESITGHCNNNSQSAQAKGL